MVGAELVTLDLDSDHDLAEQLSKALRQDRHDLAAGMVFWGVDADSFDRQLEICAIKEIPVCHLVVDSEREPDLQIPNAGSRIVRMNPPSAASRVVVEALRDAGHRNTAFVSWVDRKWSHARFSAVREHANAAGIEVHPFIHEHSMRMSTDSQRDIEAIQKIFGATVDLVPGGRHI